MWGRLFRFSPITFLFVVCLSFSGCKGELKPGHYEGSFLKRNGQEVVQENVKIEVSHDSFRSIKIDIKTVQGLDFGSASIRELSDHKIEINAEFLSKNPIVVEPVRSDSLDKKTKCFANYSDISIELCLKKDRFLLQALNQKHIPFLQLSANSFKVEEPLFLESPVSLNLTEAVNRSFERNFASRIAYEHVVQARYQAMAAYLNLMPHLTINLIWNAAPNYVTFIATVQSLAPFLLPTYWFHAKASSYDREVKDLALTIMRANLATSVEELTYALDRDNAILKDQKSFLEKVQRFRIEVDAFPLSAKTKKELYEFIQFVQDSLNSDIGDIERLIQQDRFSLSKILGYHNIEAVKDVKIDRELFAIERAVEIDPLEIAQIATERSFELRQFDYLREIARLRKVENLFVWIDPSGDPKQNLGFNLIAQQKHIESQIREIDLQREKMKTDIHQGAYKLGLDYNEAIRTYRIVSMESEKKEFDFNQIIFDALAGQVNLERLKAHAQKYIGSQVAVHTTLSNYRITRARKDRYMLGGYYTELLPRVYFSPSLKPGVLDVKKMEAK